jgi:hypothetical protein
MYISIFSLIPNLDFGIKIESWVESKKKRLLVGAVFQVNAWVIMIYLTKMNEIRG